MRKAVICMPHARYEKHRENIIADMSELVLNLHYDCGAPIDEIDEIRPSLYRVIGRWWDSLNTYEDPAERFSTFRAWLRSWRPF